LEQDINTAAV